MLHKRRIAIRGQAKPKPPKPAQRPFSAALPTFPHGYILLKREYSENCLTEGGLHITAFAVFTLGASSTKIALAEKQDDMQHGEKGYWITHPTITDAFVAYSADRGITRLPDDDNRYLVYESMVETVVIPDVK